MAQYESGT